MKKFIKNNILGFILGAIIFGSIGVIAYNYKAENVTYTPDDTSWNVNNVKSAISDLKETSNTTKKELKDTKAELNETKSTLTETQNTLTQTQSTLSQTQTALTNAQSELAKSNKVFLLGNGTSFNIKSMAQTAGNKLYGVDYTKLTVNNFVVTSQSNAIQYYTGGSDLVANYPSHPAYVQYVAPTKSYNASTGVLTVGNANAYGYVAGSASWSVRAYATSTVYLVIGTIK